MSTPVIEELGLDALAADPARALGLARPALERLAVKAIAAHTAILTALLTVPAVTAMPQAAVDPLLTIPEAARALKVPPSHVYELARRLEFPTVRFGRHVRVRGDALARWIEEHRGDGGVDFRASGVQRLRPVRREHR